MVDYAKVIIDLVATVYAIPALVSRVLSEEGGLINSLGRTWSDTYKHPHLGQITDSHNKI